MTGKVKVKVGVAIAVPIFLLLAFGSILWLNRPFQVELASYRTSLADRTEAQRHNMRQAVIALDGVVIEPGETFSFNQVVGPRTPERGYREAPAFMERDLVKSIGGGICQVSSTVYNAAALAGLTIVERHPHSRRVTSVPPGRDATVWYGMTDLRFQNVHAYPKRLAVRVANDVLFVAVLARHGPDRQIFVRTESIVSSMGTMAFQTLRTIVFLGRPEVHEVLSIDVYDN